MDEPPPFDRFLAAVRAARAADYPAVAPAEFERMRDYLLRLYAGVTPVGTRRGPGGAVVDLIPFEQYPTVRAAVAAGHAVAHAGPRPTGFGEAPAGPAPPAGPPGPVGLARLTLADLARYGTFARFRDPTGKYSGE